MSGEGSYEVVDFPPVPCVGEKVRSLEKEEDDTGSKTKLVVVGGIKI